MTGGHSGCIHGFPSKLDADGWEEKVMLDSSGGHRIEVGRAESKPRDLGSDRGYRVAHQLSLRISFDSVFGSFEGEFSTSTGTVTALV